MISEDNKRIAKNTILLYVRTLFSQLLGLYTSRKVLEILGVSDYGVYNVVGGVVTMLTFLNGSMAVATSRFLTIELGRNNMKAYNKIFSMSVNIHLFLAIIVFIVAETVGLWFVNTYLNIPMERMAAANWVYQTSLVAIMLSIIQTPYSASITAHEHMNIYAYVGMMESVLKLSAVFLLLAISYDRLVFYGFMMLGVTVNSVIIYRIYCLKHFNECRYHKIWDKSLFQSMLDFTGWNMFGSVAWVLKGQGSNMLMNIFGGPLINAARGVSYQVSSAVQNLVSGFSAAVAPQLTKKYASENREALNKLLMTSSKISFVLLLFVALPVSLEISYLLDLWLVDVPQYANVFTRIILLEALCETLGSPMITSLLATGKIKWYQIVVGSVMLLNIPLSYILLKIGFPIFIPLVVSLVLTAVALILRLWFCKKQISLSVRTYVWKVLIPLGIVILLSAIFPTLVSLYMDEGFLRLLSTTITSVLFVGICSYFFGLSKNERYAMHSLVVNGLKKVIR